MDRRPLNFTGNSLTIRSPEFGSGEDYPENLVCLYNIPTHCPNKRHIHRVQWTRGDFVLEPAVDVGFLDDTCSDFVELITTSNVTKLRDGGAILRDRIQPTAACGTQTEFSDHNSGPTLNVSVVVHQLVVEQATILHVFLHSRVIYYVTRYCMRLRLSSYYHCCIPYILA